MNENLTKRKFIQGVSLITFVLLSCNPIAEKKKDGPCEGDNLPLCIATVVVASNSSVSSEFSISGTITGLTSDGLILQNNGGDNLSIPANSTSFTFPTKVSSGKNYSVTIQSKPAGMLCSILSASGVATANVSNIAIACFSPWTKISGASGVATYGYKVLMDSKGNLIVTGYTRGGLDGNTLTGQSDLFLMKYDRTGNKIWTKQIGVATKNTNGAAIVVDSSDNIYATGTTAGNFDGNTGIGTTDALILKYDTNGNKLWSKQIGVAGVQTLGYSIALDSGSNILISGQSGGGLEGNTKIGSNYDGFLLKYDNSGTKLWAKQIGVASADTKSEVLAIDSSDNVFVAGITSGGLDGNTLVGTGDLYLSKYDSNGNRLWTKQTGAAGASSFVGNMTLDSSGNPYIVGTTSGNFDGSTKNGNQDAYVINYDSDGNKKWVKLIGASGATTGGKGIRVDSSGNIFVSGGVQGGLDGNTATGSSDAYVTKLDSSRNKIWTKQIGVASKIAVAYDICLDSTGIAFVVGHSNGDFDGVSSVGQGDAFLTTKFNE